MKLVDLSGKRFGRWLVIRREGTAKGGQPLWLCRCDCGIEKTVHRNNLSRGRSHGCITCGNSKRPPEFRWLYNVVIKLNKRFSEPVMSFTEFLTFTKCKFCFYCEKPLKWHPISGRSKGHGHHLDRKNTKKGYTKRNCAPCCTECNRIKCELLTSYEMQAVAKLLNKIRNRRKRGEKQSG